MKVRVPSCCGNGRAGLNIQDEGSFIGSATTINFVGGNIQAVKNSDGSVTVSVSGSGGGGSSSIIDFAMTNLLPSNPSAGARYRIVLSPPYTPVQIGNVFYNHYDIIEYTSGGYWIRYENDTSDQ